MFNAYSIDRDKVASIQNFMRATARKTDERRKTKRPSSARRRWQPAWRPRAGLLSVISAETERVRLSRERADAKELSSRWRRFEWWMHSLFSMRRWVCSPEQEFVLFCWGGGCFFMCQLKVQHLVLAGARLLCVCEMRACGIHFVWAALCLREVVVTIAAASAFHVLIAFLESCLGSAKTNALAIGMNCWLNKAASKTNILLGGLNGPNYFI
jgi:hypothetical protein